MSIQVTKRPYSKVFSGNPVHYELYSSESLTDDSIYFEVKVMFKTPGGTYAALHDPLQYYPVDGYAEVDVKDILHSVLEYGIPAFQTPESEIWQAPKQTGFFYLQYREITSANPNPSWDAGELEYESFVIKGGLNYFHYRGNNYWVNYYPVQHPFLTWQQSGRLAAANERMYLAWLADYTTNYPVMHVKVYYTDGTDSGDQTFGFPAMGDFKTDFIYYLPVGCNQLGLAALDPAKSIWYWTVQVVGDDGSTEIFKYELDNINDYNQTTLNYRNSVGGLDSVRIRGVVEQNLNYDFAETETTITADYFSGDTIQPQKRIADSTEQMVYKGDIGHLKKEEQDRLRDAFLQREVYWEVSKKWWPIIISSKNNKLRTSNDQRWTMPIEWQLAYNGGEYYTPKSVDLGDGVFANNVCRATLTPLVVSYSVIESKWQLAVTETDPESASTQYRFRVIKDSDSSVVIDWTVSSYGLLTIFPSTIANNTGTYTLEAQAICANNIAGKKSSIQFDTTTGGGGTPTPPPAPGTTNSQLNNNTSFNSDFTVDVDTGSQTITGNVGAFNVAAFDITDAAAVPVILTLDFIPSLVKLTSASVLYLGTYLGSNQWKFDFVDISGGLTIDVS